MWPPGCKRIVIFAIDPSLARPSHLAERATKFSSKQKGGPEK